MRKLLFVFLKILKRTRRLRLKLTGKTGDDIHVQRIVSGKAWDEFCDQLKLAGANHDPAFPVLRRMVYETVKMGADNPDNIYLNAQISGQYEYRITGKRNTIDYIGFFTRNGNYGSTGSLAPCGKLENNLLSCKPDGSFEIILSKTPKGKNWLKIEDATSLVMVRQTFLDRASEIPAEMSISNLDGRIVPDPVTPAQIDEGLKTAAMFVAGASLLFARWAKGFSATYQQASAIRPRSFKCSRRG